MNDLIKDQYGLLYSSELLLSIILLIFIIGIVANLSDGLNERVLSEEELSSLETIAIESSDYFLNNPGTPENWEDANFYALGASYQIDNQWKLRLGLAYDDAAVKMDYRTPRIPDSRRIWYSTGLEYKYNENLTFDMGFTYIQAKEARVEFKEGSADYENSVKIWGLSVNYKF